MPAGSAMAKASPPDNMFNGSEVRFEQSKQSDYIQYAQNRRISASQAKSAAMRSHPGAQYQNVQLIDENTYRVRLKKNGHIIDVYVDARTGKVKN